MTIALMNSLHVVSANATLSSFEKSVYLALVCFTDNQTGQCFPSMDTLAKYAGCSPRRASDAVNSLVALGYITKQSRKRKGTNSPTSNLYTLHDLTGSTSGRQAPEPRVAEPPHVVPEVGQARVAQDVLETAPCAETVPHPVQLVTARSADELDPDNYISKDRSIDRARARVDQHFERDRIEQTYPELMPTYSDLAGYMAEMLTFAQTRISCELEKRDDLEKLMFGASPGDLLEFLAYIHDRRATLEIQYQRPYFKTCWINACRERQTKRSNPSPKTAATPKTRDRHDNGMHYANERQYDTATLDALIEDLSA